MNIRYRTVQLFAAATVVWLGFGIAQAQDRTGDQSRDTTREQATDRIYGSQLMTEQERNAYRERMRKATTEQERERIRAEHHERMQARAKERGVTLPAVPPAQGQSGRAYSGPGTGGSAGSGIGPGGGGGGGRGR